MITWGIDLASMYRSIAGRTLAPRPLPADGLMINVYKTIFWFVEVTAVPLVRKYNVAWQVIVGVALLAGCADADRGTSASREFVDDLGRSVQISVAPQRIVSLAPNLTELVFAAGAGSRLVAVTTADDYPPGVASIDKIGAFPLDNEAIVAKRPDLVLATDNVNSPNDLATITDLGIPVVFLSFETVADIIDAVTKIGDVAGTSDAASASASAMRQDLATLHASADSSGWRPSVLLILGIDILYAFGGESYVNELIAAAGGLSLTRNLPGQAAALSDEFVLGSNPDVIIAAVEDDIDIDRLLEYHPTWDILAAVRFGHVYQIDPDLILRPGPRVIDGARKLKQILDRLRADAP